MALSSGAISLARTEDEMDVEVPAVEGRSGAVVVGS
jgi:hypothetical protein